MKKPLLAVTVVGLVVAGCGAPAPRAADPAPGVADPAPGVGAPAPEVVGGLPSVAGPAPSDGTVTTRYPVTVVDDGAGGGATLCLGGVEESWPPSCGGPTLVGWDWAALDGAHEEEAGVRWGDAVVVGTYDGTDVTVTEVLPADARTDPDLAPPTDVDLSPPCPEPPGGWSDEPQPVLATDAVFEVAQRRADYAGGWITDRDPRTVEELDQAAADDPDAVVVPPVVTIRVTGDVAAAEADLRAVWDGPLCVAPAARTEAELLVVQREVTTAVPGALVSFVDTTTGSVQLQVVHDDGTLQSQLDAHYGAGVVAVVPELVPTGG